MPEDRQVFALIDCALYLVYLLNIYEPNKAVIQNLIFTRRQVDALGRENYKAVLLEIGRLITRVAGSTKPLPTRQADDLLSFALRDIKEAGAGGREAKGLGFERQCAAALIAANFTVRPTNLTGDFGADIIASSDDLSFAIQCKDTARPVGVKGVQEAVGARAHYKCDYAIVCATGGFTDAAIGLASSNKVALCSVDQLVQRLRTI